MNYLSDAAPAALHPNKKSGGWAGIRTPGAFRHTRFPGVHNRPLCHPSIGSTITKQSRLANLSESKLQSPEQFVERELNADIKFTKIRILSAHRIETHFINNCLDLKCIARKQRHAPLRVIETSRTGNELFDFAGKLAAHARMTFH